MVTKNYLLDFMSKSSSTTVESRKSETLNKELFPQFKDVLKGSVSNASETRNSINKPQSYKSRNIQDSNFEQRTQVKSYRDTSASNINETAKIRRNESYNDTGNSSESIKDIDKLDTSDKKKYSKENVVMESLAQVLGINQNELVELLELANINPSELADSSKTEEIASKLASMMGLEKNQAEVLKSLIAITNQQAEKYIQQQKVEKLADNKDILSQSEEFGTKKDWIRLDNENIHVSKTDTLNEKFKELMAEFKLKLEAITKKINQNPQQGIQEISEEVVRFLEQTANTLDSTVQSTGSDNNITSKDTLKHTDNLKLNETDGDKNIQGKENASETNLQDESNSADSNKYGLGMNKALESKAENQEIGESSATQFSSIAPEQAHKSSVTSGIPKLIKEEFVPKSEIINQVVEKAKVVISGDKSEMLMDLKPESLGKLSLKIVTENGMVAAKFIAESQQVKEVLEANMQLLKDTLEKQGLSVQGFSVSVQQDSPKGFTKGNWSDNKSNKNDGKSGVMDATLGMVKVAEMTDNHQKNNPYNLSDSKINLTA